MAKKMRHDLPKIASCFELGGELIDVAPYGSGHRVFSLGLDCSPCWSVNNLGIGRVNCIHPENICMTQLTVETVQKQLTPHLNELAHG